IRHDRKDSTWEDCVVNWDQEKSKVDTSGSFVAELRVEEITRPSGTSKPFQIALALGEHHGDKVRWNNRTPVLPQTLGTVSINGPTELSDTLQLIAACPDPMGWGEYNPVSLVRAVNRLQSMGKEEAISALRAFARLAPVETVGFDSPDVATIDTTDQQRLC